MLTQLSTLKARLETIVTDFDDILTNSIKAVSARFEKEANRTFGWGINLSQEFMADSTEIVVSNYPIASINGFYIKTTDDESWVPAEGVQFLTRNNCVISLQEPLGTWRQQAYVDYNGGYNLPGDDPSPYTPPPLPDDLEQAADEQCAAWFLNRDKVGLEVNWPKGGVYQKFSQLPLLPSVQETLKRYRRIVL